MDSVVSVQSVVKDFERGPQLVRALAGVSLDVGAGEIVAVVGPSGSGKSTLLHLMGALDSPTSGSVCISGTDVGRLGDDDRTALRRDRIGFVFQFFNLLPALSAWENVAVPLVLRGQRLRRSRAEVMPLMGALGLGARVDHRPGELSGGELQRVAIARALVAEPALVLADEPTGNLDTKTGADVIDALERECRLRSAALVIVTHDDRVAGAADRKVQLVDGQLRR